MPSLVNVWARLSCDQLGLLVACLANAHLYLLTNFGLLWCMQSCGCKNSGFIGVLSEDGELGFVFFFQQINPA